MTRQSEDAALWAEAVGTFGGAALVDIQQTAGVSLSVARRLRLREPMGGYLHAGTRDALTRWRDRTRTAAVAQSSGPAAPLPGVPPRSFATDAERHAYTLGVLDLAQVSVGEASRAISSASAALLAPLTGALAAHVLETVARVDAARQAHTSRQKRRA